MKATVPLPEKLVPIFQGPARYRVAHGGRGSGKTMGFAIMAVVKAYELSQQGKTGTILCLREHVNTLTDSTMAEIKNAIKQMPWLQDFFEVGEKYIRTKDKRIEFLFYGLTRNLDSLKSLAQIHVAWVDEAARVTEEAWRKLDPSVRAEDSEIWVTYNPEHKSSSTDRRFRQKTPRNCKIVEMNFMDNPWFPTVLEDVRLNDKENRPEHYDHVWLGDYLTVVAGAYYDRQLAEAKEQGRITPIFVDKLMPTYAFFDIGGTGGKSDATAIWIAQFVGKEIRLIDYYEAQGQELSTHVAWLRKHNYHDALVVLPHDGRTFDKVFHVSFESALREAGFNVEVVPNQGRGAAMARIEEARRLFSRMVFNETRVGGGLAALRYYHAKIDEVRNVDLGPDHDWSSHCADAFGLMAVFYEEPRAHIDDFEDFDTMDWVV